MLDSSSATTKNGWLRILLTVCVRGIIPAECPRQGQGTPQSGLGILLVDCNSEKVDLFLLNVLL